MEARRFVPPQVIWLVEHALSAKLYSFSSLLRTFGQSGCQDPRDKVYGLQGMLEEQQRMEINYAKSVYEVFLDAVVIVAKNKITPGTATETFNSRYPFTTAEVHDSNQPLLAKAVKETFFGQAALATKNVVNQLNSGNLVEDIFGRVSRAMMNIVNQVNYGRPVEGIFEQAALAMMDEVGNMIDAYPMTILTRLGSQMGLEGSARAPDVLPYQNLVTSSWRNVCLKYVKMHFKKFEDDSSLG